MACEVYRVAYGSEPPPAAVDASAKHKDALLGKLQDLAHRSQPGRAAAVPTPADGSAPPTDGPEATNPSAPLGTALPAARGAVLPDRQASARTADASNITSAPMCACQQNSSQVPAVPQMASAVATTTVRRRGQPLVEETAAQHGASADGSCLRARVTATVQPERQETSSGHDRLADQQRGRAREVASPPGPRQQLAGPGLVSAVQQLQGRVDGEQPQQHHRQPERGEKRGSVEPLDGTQNAARRRRIQAQQPAGPAESSMLRDKENDAPAALPPPTLQLAPAAPPVTQNNVLTLQVPKVRRPFLPPRRV